MNKIEFIGELRDLRSYPGYPIGHGMDVEIEVDGLHRKDKPEADEFIGKRVKITIEPVTPPPGDGPGRA